jgi:hypothetical protein
MATGRWFLAAVFLAGCASRPNFLATVKPLEIGVPPQGLCLAIPTDPSAPLKYWDGGEDCSDRMSSVGETQFVSEASQHAQRTVRFDIPLHVGVAHVAVQIAANRVRSLQTGVEQPLHGLNTIPTSSIDQYLRR